jgi:hypothetical protein
MPCGCQCSLKTEAVTSDKSVKLSDDVASAHFSPNFSIPPKCPKADCSADSCKKNVEYAWTLTTTSGRLELFDSATETCLVVGNGMFSLKVIITVYCTCPTSPDGPTVGEVTKCSDDGSASFILVP